MIEQLSTQPHDPSQGRELFSFFDLTGVVPPCFGRTEQLSCSIVFSFAIDSSDEGGRMSDDSPSMFDPEELAGRTMSRRGLVAAAGGGAAAAVFGLKTAQARGA